MTGLILAVGRGGENEVVTMPVVRIVIAGENTTRVRDLAERAGLRVVGEGPSYESAMALGRDRSGEAIVVDGAPPARFGFEVPVVVVGEDTTLASAAELGALAVVPEECSEALLVAALETAAAASRAILAAQAEAGALRDQLETRKVVERAKGILMRRLGLSEAEAYRRLQKASQDENRKMREVADSIVRTEKILAENISGEPGDAHRTAG